MVNTGIIYYGGLLTFLHEVNFREILEQRYEKEVFIENDAKCAALAELWLGSVKEAKDSVVLVLGSGVGGGIIIDGKLHRGIHLSAGEVSFVMNQIDSLSKEARFIGFECSAVEMVRQIAEVKQLPDVTDGQAVFEYINQQDEEAMAIFDQYCIQLAAHIYYLQYILDPEVFAIGGGISAQPILLERIKWALVEIKKTNPLHVATPKVVTCEFENDANLYGALYNLLIS
jgi:predicted NBD/HSP70 family sugar kinase